VITRNEKLATYFPNTPPDWFWSLSTDQKEPMEKLMVDFKTGSTQGFKQSNVGAVRCIAGELPPQQSRQRKLPETIMNHPLKLRQNSEFLSKLKPKTDLPRHSSTLTWNEPVRWDFSHKRIIEYEIQHDAQLFSGTDPRHGYRILQRSYSKVRVSTEGNSLASIIMKITKIESYTKGHWVDQTPTLNITAVDVHNIPENSEISAKGQEQVTIKLLFPYLPDKLKPGESAHIPMQTPIKSGTDILIVKGYMHLKLDSIVVLSRHRHAFFQVEVELTEIENPGYPIIKIETVNRGKGFFYFDLDDGCFTSGEFVYLMSLAAVVNEGSRSSRYYLEMDNHFTYQRKHAQIPGN